MLRTKTMRQQERADRGWVSRRTGLTLVELMVALAVISILASIALPAVKNTLKEQKLPRAASVLQSAIEEGRARSIGSGGGGGIIIDRVGVDSLAQRSQSIRIRMASSPRPYTGDGGRSTCYVGIQPVTPAGPVNDIVTLWFPPSAAQMVRSAQDILNATAPTETLINPGDLVQLGDAALPVSIEGMRFGTNVGDRNLARLTNAEIPDADIANWVRVQVLRPEENLDLTRFAGKAVSYSISRRPRPAISMPIQLPEGSAIDLTASGIGRVGNEFSPMAVNFNYTNPSIAPFGSTPLDYQSVWILFGSRGEISRIRAAQIVSGIPTLVDLPVTGDVHFLVGRAGDVKTQPEGQLEDSDPNFEADEADDGTTPLLSNESIWVTIKARSGEVVTSPWTDPTDDTINLVPAVAVVNDANQQARIRTVIGRTRDAAVQSRDMGSL